MGIFDSILNKLGFGDDEKEQAAGQVNVAKEVESAMIEEQEETKEALAAVIEGDMTVVDVAQILTELSDKSSQKLDWKVSIVDLMKLLDLDSSYGSRKELADELGCPDVLMADSAQMNIWLHKRVMIRLAENGGKVPADLIA
ncbi:MAG: DUF3597 domain-containing protein [Sulfurovum sp.]|nr:DUF3597 domain-containing protein [Sulfurovum sp.]